MRTSQYVMILEDEPAMTNKIMATLDVLGINVVTACNMTEFHSILKQYGDAIVSCVVDINLNDGSMSSGMNALELLKSGPFKPFVAVYTQFDGRPRRFAQRLGADVFLSKSTSHDHDISVLIEQMLASKMLSAKRLFDHNEKPRINMVSSTVIGINQQLLEYLHKHPESLHELEPRRFEEIVATMWEKSGYTITLTPRTRDGGKDIYAAKHSFESDVLYVIECKRYNADRPVGVEVVRSLYGVAAAEGATLGIVATTSSFTSKAIEFQKSIPYRLSLRDFKDLKIWLDDYHRRLNSLKSP